MLAVRSSSSSSSWERRLLRRGPRALRLVRGSGGGASWNLGGVLGAEEGCFLARDLSMLRHGGGYTAAALLLLFDLILSKLLRSVFC